MDLFFISMQGTEKATAVSSCLLKESFQWNGFIPSTLTHIQPVCLPPYTHVYITVTIVLPAGNETVLNCSGIDQVCGFVVVPRLLESILGSYSSLERVILLVLRTLTEVAPPLTVPSSTRG